MFFFAKGPTHNYSCLVMMVTMTNLMSGPKK